MKENIMRKPKLVKVVLSAGAVETELEKSAKLLGMLSEMKPQIIQAGPRTRIPAFNVRPGLELGARVTLRKEKAVKLLRRLLGAIDNTLKNSQISDNHFSFGIKEYIEIPDMEYVREFGSRGFNVTVVFERHGVRIKNKKIKNGKLPKRQTVSKEEIIHFMKNNFKTIVEGGK